MQLYMTCTAPVYEEFQRSSSDICCEPFETFVTVEKSGLEGAQTHHAPRHAVYKAQNSIFKSVGGKKMCCGLCVMKSGPGGSLTISIFPLPLFSLWDRFCYTVEYTLAFTCHTYRPPQLENTPGEKQVMLLFYYPRHQSETLKFSHSQFVIGPGQFPCAPT